MKFLFVTLVGICAVVEVLSITCYRCGGAASSGFCSSSNNATVECADQPNAVYACQVYTVNFTTLGQVQDFKSCCLYEDCNKNPCESLGQDKVCSKMASCQSDKCNYDYATAKASQPPTVPSKACKVFFSRFVVALAALVVFYLSI